MHILTLCCIFGLIVNISNSSWNKRTYVCLSQFLEEIEIPGQIAANETNVVYEFIYQ